MADNQHDLTEPIQTITEVGLGGTGGQLDSLADASRYAVGSELARGGMGLVLNARDVKLHRNVAMKKLL